jgi:hypothetical protein
LLPKAENQGPRTKELCRTHVLGHSIENTDML